MPGCAAPQSARMWKRTTTAAPVCRISLIALAVTLTACDKPTPPPHRTDDKPAASQPTTMSLLAAPRKPLALDLIPFTLQAPQGWTVARHGDDPETALTMLDGTIVGSELHIILNSRPMLTADALKALTEHRRKESDALQKLGGYVSVRDIGDTRIIERLTMPSTATTDPTDRIVDWQIDLYVPDGLKYDAYELKVIDLTEDAYQANKQLLESVFSSLKYQSLGPPPM